MKLEVLDLASGAWRTQRPEKICRERDFYSVDLPGIDLEAVERDVIGRIESDALGIIRRLSRTRPRTGPHASEPDLKTLVHFTALMYVRTAPQRRKTTMMQRGFWDYVANQSPSTLEQLVTTARADGRTLPGDGTSEGLLEVLASGELQTDLTGNFYVGAMLQAWREVCRALLHRVPSLLETDARTGLLVTSDNPVGAYETAESNSRGAMVALDIRSPSTAVTMPLTSTLALRLDPHGLGGGRPMARDEVALVNSLSIMANSDLVLAASREFFWLDDRIQVRSSRDLLPTARARRRESEGMDRDRFRRVIAARGLTGK